MSYQSTQLQAWHYVLYLDYESNRGCGTGVARGMSSAYILHALDDDKHGKLSR